MTPLVCQSSSTWRAWFTQLPKNWNIVSPCTCKCHRKVVPKRLQKVASRPLPEATRDPQAWGFILGLFGGWFGVSFWASRGRFKAIGDKSTSKDGKRLLTENELMRVTCSVLEIDAQGGTLTRYSQKEIQSNYMLCLSLQARLQQHNNGYQESRNLRERIQLKAN